MPAPRVLISDALSPAAVQIFKDMAVALPKAPLLGPEGVGETGFFDPKEGGLPADVAKRTRITIPGVAPEEYPPAGKQFLKDYTAEYGEKNPDRYAGKAVTNAVGLLKRELALMQFARA